MSLRWASPVRAEGAEEVAALFARCGGSRTSIIVGGGFDPRAPVAYECIAAAAPAPIDVVRIPLDSLNTDAATAGLAESARARIEAAARECGGTIRDQANGGEGASSTGMVVARTFFDSGYVNDYEQVVVDISALPRSVYFPLIRGLLELYDQKRWEGDLHVIACDNPAVDARVAGEGVEPPVALPGFADRTSIGDSGTRIWAPLLGEGETARLEALYLDIGAEEICPVLPFPASDPRRCDDLIREFRELLFDRIEVEPRNIIYAAESNPFDLYRTLSALDERYSEALQVLGETRMVLSALSSKLLSVGALLVAYERGLEVRHSAPSLYSLAESEGVAALAEHDLVVDLWLTGEPYE